MAVARQNLGGVYANMDFPPYEFKEFPKAVPVGPHGQTTIVSTKEEENILLKKIQKDHDDAPAEVIPSVPDPEKEILISRARELGAAFNSKWSKAKLKATIDAAEMEIDNLPPEGEEENEEPDDGVQELSLNSLRPMDKSYNDQEALKESLLEEAKALGLKGTGMHLWGIPRLKAAIAEHNQAK